MRQKKQKKNNNSCILSLSPPCSRALQWAAAHIHSSIHTCTHNTDPHQRWFIKLGKQNINDSLEPALFISTQTKTDSCPPLRHICIHTHTHTLSSKHFQTSQ